MAPNAAIAAKHEVGIRELHDQLSRYVRHVAEGGEEVVVTMRGRPVARLAPVDEPDPIADWDECGRVEEPVRPRTRITRDRLLRTSGGLVSDFVAEQRR